MTLSRLLVTVLLALVLAVPVTAGSEQTSTLRRIGSSSPGTRASLAEVFQTQLAELGYVRCRDIVIDERSTDGTFEEFAGAAKEPVRLPVDGLVAWGPGAADAARKAMRASGSSY